MIENYSITQYYIRKRNKENTLKTHRTDVYLGTENMDSAEVLFRTFTYGIKGRRTKLFAEKWFSDVHNHFLKLGTVSDHRSKKVSPGTPGKAEFEGSSEKPH